jgi:nitrogen fixation-related uncharacterized protein
MKYYSLKKRTIWRYNINILRTGQFDDTILPFRRTGQFDDEILTFEELENLKININIWRTGQFDDTILIVEELENLTIQY